jgi:hypothetical protein
MHSIRGYLKRLTKLGQISDHTLVDTLLIPSDNDISISAGYDDHRVKRATDKNAGWLKSKNIKSTEYQQEYDHLFVQALSTFSGNHVELRRHL